MENTDNSLFFDIAPKIDLAKYEINIIELGGDSIELKSLIHHAVTKGLILYRNVDFLPYPPDIPFSNTKFFNLFLGFKARLAIEINPAIIDPILWHAKNIIFDRNEELSKYFWYWCAYLVQQLSKKPGTIQARKLIVMNETVERKDIEPKVIKDYARFMVLTNHDAPLQIEMGDHHIVCFDVSSRCKGNMVYFKNLAKVLEHPDIPNVVMAYLLSLDISDWNPQDIPATKMKTDIMLEHLPNSKRFIIDHISSWPENRTKNSICSNLYQEYRIWCERNGKNLFTNKKFGKTPSTIGIERKQAQINGKRDWVYTLDRSKIVRKLRELAKNIARSSTTDYIEKSKKIVSTPPTTNMTQDLFDFITNESLVASSSKSTNISPLPEIVHIELVDDKSEPVSEIIKPVNDKVESLEIIELINDSEIFPDLPVNNKPKTINEVSPQQISCLLGYQTREQQEIRLRQKAIKLSENSDKF
ncbi:10153_t:CDS:2, partial [Scutellospora calospora]